MNDSRKGALLVILAGSCWGLISIFINYLSAAGLGTLQISFLRQMMSATVFGLFVLFRHPDRFRIRFSDILLLMLVGLVNGVMFNYLYFYTIINSRASIAVVLLYTSPVFVMIMSRIFFRERITSRKITALILTVAGCVLVTGILGEGYTPPVRAILTGIGTGFAYALNNIITSKAVRKNDPETVTVYTLLFSFLFLIPFCGGSSLAEAIRSEPSILLVTFIMCLTTGVLAQFVFSKGLRYIESGRAAIYAASEPIVGTLVGILIFHEETGLLKLSGIVMVITAILLMGTDEQPS